jgi:NAD(P)H dehydrogenase (quinone)
VLVRRAAAEGVLAQQEKVAWADGLAFIAPIYWMNFHPSIRGWIEGVFTYGFVYTMTREAGLQATWAARSCCSSTARC